MYIGLLTRNVVGRVRKTTIYTALTARNSTKPAR